MGAKFTDLSKAIHTLGHSKFLVKLNGLEDIELEWFTNYFIGRAQIVKVNENCPNYVQSSVVSCEDQY